MKLKIPENLTQRAYRLIQDEIIRGELDGRQHLTEGYFANRFGISKSPIREALNRLESEGLIAIIPRRGAFVAQFSIHDVEEIYELREVLEALVVRDAVLDSKTLARMKEAVRSAETYLKKNDRLNYIREDAAFHNALAQANSNLRLRKMLDNMHNQMLIMRRQTFELTSHTSVKQHRRILQALEKGRRETATRLMLQHIRSVRARLIDHLNKQNRKEDARERPPTQDRAKLKN